MKIDKNVPIPQIKGRGAKAKYPFSELEIGDSFRIEGRWPNDVSSTRKYWEEKLGRKFSTRREGFGMRVWRVA